MEMFKLMVVVFIVLVASTGNLRAGTIYEAKVSKYTKAELLELSGTVSETWIRGAEKLGWDGVKGVIVSSPGGDAVAALKLVDIFDSRGINVHITGWCGSACANYLFLLPRRPAFVDPSTRFIFHGDVRSILRSAFEEGEKFIDPMAIRFISMTAKTEEERFKKRFFESNVLAFGAVVVSPKSYSRDIMGEDGLIYRCSGMEKMAWAPSLKVLKDLGVVFEISPVEAHYSALVESVPPHTYEGGIIGAPNCEPWPRLRTSGSAGMLH
ncbi:hypothetical protein [Paucibacter sp. DJ2R-2]|uniref:hypothetical protein n=1 Tax=Paucibacter sp. DJ2R-2 TaxID=2893558 RepID=UPI0021E4EAD9|nr:hypothetical protein [Paucibacter sp. DJ2R-2]MCV2436900.1 hypothetical protein [Paucibacter sp. DJ2R-2]